MIDRELTGGHTNMAYPRKKMTMDDAIKLAKKECLEQTSDTFLAQTKNVNEKEAITL